MVPKVESQSKLKSCSGTVTNQPNLIWFRILPNHSNCWKGKTRGSAQWNCTNSLIIITLLSIQERQMFHHQWNLCSSYLTWNKFPTHGDPQCTRLPTLQAGGGLFHMQPLPFFAKRLFPQLNCDLPVTNKQPYRHYKAHPQIPTHASTHTHTHT